MSNIKLYHGTSHDFDFHTMKPSKAGFIYFSSYLDVARVNAAIDWRNLNRIVGPHEMRVIDVEISSDDVALFPGEIDGKPTMGVLIESLKDNTFHELTNGKDVALIFNPDTKSYLGHALNVESFRLINDCRSSQMYGNPACFDGVTPKEECYDYDNRMWFNVDGTLEPFVSGWSYVEPPAAVLQAARASGMVSGIVRPVDDADSGEAAWYTVIPPTPGKMSLAFK